MPLHEVQLQAGETTTGVPVVVMRIPSFSLDSDANPFIALDVEQAEALGMALIRAAGDVVADEDEEDGEVADG